MNYELYIQDINSEYRPFVAYAVLFSTLPTRETVPHQKGVFWLTCTIYSFGVNSTK